MKPKTMLMSAALIAATAGGAAWLFAREAPEPDRSAGIELAAAGPVVTVYKNPNCVCCEAWADHLRSAGFEVALEPVEDMAAVKRWTAVPDELQACHTAVVEGRIIEGHVPADLIRQFLAERTADRGLAVPGMPLGAPGMEGPYDEQSFDVLAFGGPGSTRVYASR